MKDAFSDEPRKRSSSDDITDRPSRRSPPPDDDEPDREESRGKLGSLAQAARGKKLKEARGILIAIGVLTIIVNVIFIAIARNNVKSEIEKEITKAGGRGNVQIDQAKLQEVEDHAVMIVRLVNGVAVALGVVFIILGVIVNRFPVPATIISLILYVGSALGFAALDPSTLARGAIIKIIIVVALIKAIQAALAYEKERQRSASVELVD